MKKLLLVLLAFSLSELSYAQENELRDFYLPISSIDAREGNRVQVTIGFGGYAGISVGMECSVWGLHYSDFPTHNESTLAKGQIISMTDTSAVAVLTELDTSSVKQVYAGDLLNVQLTGKEGYQGIFYDMLTYSIFFNDQNELLINDYSNVFYSDSEEMEQDYLDEMSEDIRSLGLYLVDQMDDQDIESGLFDGQTMLTAMQETNSRDVLSFLRYVNARPAKYLGKTWKISETYATWMTGGSPLVQTDVSELIVGLQNEQDIQAFSARYGDLIDADMVLDIGGEFENLISSEYSEAIRRMANLTAVVDISQDADKMAWAYYRQARMFNTVKEYENTIEAYLKSRENFNKTSNNYGLSYTLNNLAFAYESMENLTDAITYYKEAIVAKNNMFEANRTNDNLENVADAYYRLGDTELNNGDYEDAIGSFEKSIEFYSSTDNTEKVLSMMEYKANCFAKQGNLTEAVGIHQERISIAEKTGDTDQVADATFDIAYTYNGFGDEYELGIPFYRKSHDLHLAIGDTTMATLSISNVAQSYWSLKDLEKSIENHKATIQLAEASGEKSRIADSWDKLADLYKENGNPKKSLEAYDRVIEVHQEMEDPDLAVTLNEVGNVYYDAKDYIKAVSYYRRSAEMARKNFDFEQSSDALFDIADAYYSEKKYDLAKHFYEESMADAARMNYASQEIYCLANIALIEGINDEYAKSDSTYAVALEKAERLGDKQIVAFCKYRLGGTAARQRNYDKAERLYNESLELYRELDERMWQVNVLNVLSGMFSNRGEFDQALALLDEGFVISKEDNDRNNMAYAYVYKSDIYLRILGEFDKAWEMQEASMKLFAEVDNTWGIADSYLGFGNIKNLSGEYAEAIDYYEKCDSLYLVLGNEYARATPVNNIGTIYYWQGDYETSLGYFNSAMGILDSLGIKDAFRSLVVSNIGVIYLEQKQYEKSEKWMLEALTDAREINDVNQISTNLTYLGKLKTETKEYKEARKYILESLKLEESVGLKTNQITSNFALGKLAYLDKSKGAKDYIQKSIDLSVEMGSDKELWEAYYYKGLIAQEAGKLDESKEHFIDAIETLEKIQGKIVGGAEAQKIFTSGEKQIKVYASLVDVLIMKGEIKLGMQYLERSNIESLRSKFKSLDIAFKDDDSNEKLEKEKELKRKLDNLERSIADEKSGQSSDQKIQKLELSKGIAENEYLLFVNKTINTNPELAKHFSGGFHPRKLKTDKNRRLIPDELVVLSYLPANDKLYIFAATSDTVIAKVVNVSTEELNRNIKFIYNFAVHGLDGHKTDRLRVARGDDSSPFPEEFDRGNSRYKETSEKLFNWVIAPVRAELDKKSKVVVIPTGMLHFLPFQMLGERLNNGKFDFLIEHYTLFYAHSLDMLYQQKDEINEVSILAMANADNSLPAAEQEVKDLKKLCPNTDVFLHGEASEDKAKTHTGTHNILHFATHGNLDYFDYNKSYLTLAPNADGSEDGRLTIEEVWEIEDIYNYQMITLSACKTAVTDDFSTGWAVSPATSFIDAGAPTVVASLWAVNDASTGLLMKYFYANLKTMTKVEALRRAQIQLSQKEEFSHPYFWAPFILIGDWR